MRCGLVALWFGAFLTMNSSAQSSGESLEYRIKAAFVCKFANYVDWPAHAFSRPEEPLVIGVIATDAVFEELARAAASLPVGGRPLIVRKVKRGEPILSNHLLYITQSGNDHLAETLAAIKGHPVLSVTESSRGTTLGSMINFVVVDDRVRFDISPQAAGESELKISARLLGVARAVVPKGS